MIFNKITMPIGLSLKNYIVKIDSKTKDVYNCELTSVFDNEILLRVTICGMIWTLSKNKFE